MNDIVKLQIFIMARDRPVYLREALRSLLDQKCDFKYKIIVSDNSQEEDVKNMLRERQYSGVGYIRRNPPVDIALHIKRIFLEISSEFVVIFHDDDRFMSGYCSEMVKNLERDRSLSAVACNSFILSDKKRSNNLLMLPFSEKIRIDERKKFLSFYTRLLPIRPAQYSGYMYRSESLKKMISCSPDRSSFQILGMDWEDQSSVMAGKYSDIALLTGLLNYGPILWVPDVLLIYRVHYDNDGSNENIGHRTRLVRYFSTCLNVGYRSHVFDVLRFRFWLRWRINPSIRRSKLYWRKAIISRYLVGLGVKLLFTEPYFIYRIVKRIR